MGGRGGWVGVGVGWGWGVGEGGGAIKEIEGFATHICTSLERWEQFSRHICTTSDREEFNTYTTLDI